MIDANLLLPVAAAFGAGVLLAWLATTLAQRRRGDAERLAAARRVAAAEATAAAERGQRQTLERDLHEAEARLHELGRRLAVADERVEQARRLIAEQSSFVDSSRKELEDTFQALAGRALQQSSEQFLALASQRLAAARSSAAAELDERKQAIAHLLEPLRETLGRLESRTAEIEKARLEAYSRIDSQVLNLAGATATLQEQTTSLAAALKGSQVRGRWGEIALRNIAELAGMSAHCDFYEQTAVDDGGRPDMIVKLPEQRWIAVDAKAPLTAYLEATEATEERRRHAALDRHVKALRQHVRTLAGRDYAANLAGDVDLVVMFLPGDPFLAAAFERDPDLQVEALRAKVLLATPTTLVALLRTVAIYWQQRSLADNARAIAEVAEQLYDRAAKFGEELAGVGRGLRQALDAYNRAAGSFQHRLMPMGRKLDEMKVAEHTKRDLTAPEPVDGEPRES